MAPAHPQATGVAVYPTFFFGGGGLLSTMSIFVLAATILNKEYRCAHHWDHCDDQGRFLYGATSFMLAESILVLLICLWTINETAAFITKTKGCCPCCYEKYTHSAAESQVRQFEVFLLTPLT